MPSPGRKGSFKTWPKKEQQKHLATVRRAKNRKKAFVDSLKDKPCADCGGRFPTFVMDFDHCRGKKEFELSYARENGFSKERILREAKKCDVVCSNCHRIRTFRRKPY